MSSLSVLRPLDTTPRFAHPPPTGGPRTVDLTVRLVVDGDPARLIDALREFVERLDAGPAHRPAVSPAADPVPGGRLTGVPVLRSAASGSP